MCGTEHDYDVDWKLVKFNSTVNQICPRKAQGNDIIRFTYGCFVKGCLNANGEKLTLQYRKLFWIMMDFRIA